MATAPFTSTTSRSGGLLSLAAVLARASAVTGAVGVAFLIAMFTAFAVGARSAGMTLGWINDVLVLVTYLITAPVVLAVHELLRGHAPARSAAQTVLGLLGIAGVVTLQALLVAGVMTFEQQIGPVSVAFLVVMAWLVLAGHLGSATGALPRGTTMGLLAATYVGQPVWAVWISRRLGDAATTRS